MADFKVEVPITIDSKRGAGKSIIPRGAAAGGFAGAGAGGATGKKSLVSLGKIAASVGALLFKYQF